MPLFGDTGQLRWAPMKWTAKHIIMKYTNDTNKIPLPDVKKTPHSLDFFFFFYDLFRFPLGTES